jgi:hypothetical protein
MVSLAGPEQNGKGVIILLMDDGKMMTMSLKENGWESYPLGRGMNRTEFRDVVEAILVYANFETDVTFSEI